MPRYCHETTVDVPIQSVWEFVSKMNNWAPLVPGYLEHNILSEKESTWSFLVDIGIVKKKIQLKVNITSWLEPTKVTFDLTGLNEKFTGHGYFQAEALNKNNTSMTGCLDITADGIMAKVANSILHTTLPEITTELTDAVAAKIEELFAKK